MSTVFVAVAYLCVLSTTLQESDDNCVHPKVEEVLPVTAHDYIRSVVAPSMYDCAAECKLSSRCLFFTFDHEECTCQILKKTNPSFTVGTGLFFSSIQEWKMPLTGACDMASCGPNSRCTEGRNGHPLCLNDDVLIGMKCTNDDDCHVNMTSCFRGRCLCHPGYSHNIRRNSCDRFCQRLGDSMTPYQGLGIKRHNVMAIETAKGKEALEMCMSACVHETAFKCKTIDFQRRPLRCFLSNVGYLDVEAKERERGLHGWWFAVRKCH
ncbi:uncharacterized protein [Haliotis asinina]|uniref:uncharacterized protein n=1 Tax=Haliotis asinina TaxID=109174 RepID=UPI00353190D9